MSTIHICDGCKKRISFLDAVRFWGSKKLGEISFCDNCFVDIENYVMGKFKLDIKERIEKLENAA